MQISFDVLNANYAATLATAGKNGFGDLLIQGIYPKFIFLKVNLPGDAIITKIAF